MGCRYTANENIPNINILFGCLASSLPLCGFPNLWFFGHSGINHPPSSRLAYISSVARSVIVSYY